MNHAHHRQKARNETPQHEKQRGENETSDASAILQKKIAIAATPSVREAMERGMCERDRSHPPCEPCTLGQTTLPSARQSTERGCPRRIVDTSIRSFHSGHSCHSRAGVPPGVPVGSRPKGGHRKWTVETGSIR